MKKFFSIILIACLALAVMAVAPVSAANDEVLVGTPTVDGVIDDIYLGSLAVEYAGAENNAVADQAWYSANLTVYALYDGAKVYLAADVKDDDVVSAADSFVMENSNPYCNDVVEFRLDLNGGDAMFKIGVDAYGKRAYTIQPNFCNIDEVEYATKITDDGYVIEVAFPYATLETNDVVAAGKLGLKIWLFDLHGDYAGVEAPTANVHFTHFARDFDGEGAGTPVFYNLSEERAVAPSAGGDTTGTTTAPSTFDPALIAVVLTAASGAAFVFASKKH